MEPVVSYQDLLNYLSARSRNNPIIPILLLPPSHLVTSRRKRTFAFDEVFDYYHHLTNNDIVFFLPGYSHHPGGEYGFFGGFGGAPNMEAFSYTNPHQLGEQDNTSVYYSTRAYAQFVRELNEKSHIEVYTTTLLLAEILMADGVASPGIDSNAIKPYHLSYLYRNERSEPLDYFLTRTVNILKDISNGSKNHTDAMRDIDMEYAIAKKMACEI